ncbi:hypothetical protein J6590_068145 [Homalodisca vitripennis]|nr:hypothetical protein J6590_068145 [Homalodisca vitripennis]
MPMLFAMVIYLVWSIPLHKEFTQIQQNSIPTSLSLQGGTERVRREKTPGLNTEALTQEPPNKHKAGRLVRQQGSTGLLLWLRTLPEQFFNNRVSMSDLAVLPTVLGIPRHRPLPDKGKDLRFCELREHPGSKEVDHILEQ